MTTLFQLGTVGGAPGPVPSIIVAGRTIDLRQAASDAGVDLPPFTAIADLLGNWDDNFDRLGRIADHAAASDAADVREPDPPARTLVPLGRVGKMLFAAANYRDHVVNMQRAFTEMPLGKEAGERPALRPYMFGRMNVPSGAYDDIVLPVGMERIDWEAELMVVIGAPGFAIGQSQAHRHIAGYMACNDVSCRDRTWRPDRPGIRSDWLGGTSYDSFSPIGPVFTPRQFVPDHADLAIRLWVNGDLKQDGNSGDMTFGIEEQIEYASSMMTLLPGDVIATGTPAGTGQERGEYLKEGDIVELEIERCGRQRNRVVARRQGIEP